MRQTVGKRAVADHLAAAVDRHALTEVATQCSEVRELKIGVERRVSRAAIEAVGTRHLSRDIDRSRLMRQCSPNRIGLPQDRGQAARNAPVQHKLHLSRRLFVGVRLFIFIGTPRQQPTLSKQMPHFIRAGNHFFVRSDLPWHN